MKQHSLAWVWPPSERGFFQTAVQGIIISSAFAFVVLLFATRNLLLASVAILCVLFVAASVMAIIVLKEWELGVSESINVTILIGFSVDYVIHLAADYMHSAAVTRNAKMDQAYREMGISILSGMLTTAVAGSFLFLGAPITFTKFATLVCSTVTISFLVSMIFFGAVMHSIGPVDGFCDFCNSHKTKKTQVAAGPSSS